MGVGAACEATCADGLSCVIAEGFTDGYCSAVCDDATCPVGAVCDTSFNPSLCLSACTAGSQCRSGYQCWRGGCRPSCSGDSDCGGATCNAGQCEGCATAADCAPGMACVDNECVPGVDGGGTAPFGTPCASGGECASGLCLSAEAGGVCGQDCASANDCFGLPIEAACSAIADAALGVRLACTPFLEAGGSMAQSCAVDSDCQARTCQDGQCTEGCASDADCTIEPMICTTHARFGGTYSACGYAERTGPVDVVDFGEATLPGAGVANHTLALPPDAVSLTLEVFRSGGDRLDVTFGEVRDPSDTVLYDLGTIAELTDVPNRWIPIDTGAVATMLVPNTTPDRVAFRRGRYDFTAGLFAGQTGGSEATVSMRALIKRAPDGASSTGTLDLNIFLVNVGLDAAAAATDARLQSALSRLNSILFGQGIRLGATDYFEIGGADATRLGVIDSTTGEDSELSDLFRLSAGRTGRRLNIFLVRQIEGDGEGFAALGIAGGIPGPVDRHGTHHSGVVAAFDPGVVGGGSDGARVVGHILAHEIGHYLGLFHATERLRPCGPGEVGPDCAPFGGGDVLADTAPGDTRNLMYWSIVGSGLNDEISGGQGTVMRASALVGP